MRRDKSLRESTIRPCTKSRRLPDSWRSLPSSIDLTADVRPPLKAARHRRHVLISHLHHRQGCKRRAISARAVDHDFLRAVDQSFDPRLEIATRQMHGVWQPSEIPLVGLAHIEIDDALVARLHLAYLLGCH